MNSELSMTRQPTHDELKVMAANYIRENFEPTDRIAIVLLNKRTAGALQRIAAADRLAAPQFQAWLRHMNSQKYDVYVSMNTLKPEAQRRTKEDVDQIRHVFLDFDQDGTTAVEALLRREDLPEPNYLLNSSPDKWQVIWKIQNCSKLQAEEIERGLVRDTGADIAVIDVARVLRMPGFYNHKYSRPYLIQIQHCSNETTAPEQFPRFVPEGRTGRSAASRIKAPTGRVTQSERDWAYVREALRRGTEPEQLIEELKVRRSDKFDPEGYATRTVRNAAVSLGDENGPASGSETARLEPDR